ncbi:hypothetical protein SAY86_021103 [Trapa natans]|uniref:Two-component response regulator-like APRR7 n=1 Tax=Trapa natans TaxID=22666 RepID=A0AAN7MTK3_TRANT|nr:hypothetical protein SAY86_021103 [Trapa natans]
MKVDGDGNNLLFERSYSSLEVDKRVKDSIAGGEKYTSKEDGLTSNGDLTELQDGLSGPAQNQTMLHIQQQQQPQASIVHWEKFLHIRSLKVLLVENDDSTRHIVSALLRNCSYGVIEASNALQAWKILEDLTNHVDLVLAEVSMPTLSGIVLLSKIMSHKTRKNVPVIMMSSHDSMGLVFKCLSKGAVDFLVKPIRKNELKNLWQHVWRRCHSSSGSGSESGTQSQKSVRSKSNEKSGNNIGSNDDDENGSTSLNVGDGRDSGSGTQSSWTKQAVEIDSPQPPCSWNHVVECADSTCAQVMPSNVEEASRNKQVSTIAARECKELDQIPENVAVGRELELGLCRNPIQRVEHSIIVSPKSKCSKPKNALDNLTVEMDKGKIKLFDESTSGKAPNDVVSLAGITMNIDSLTGSKEFEGSNRVSRISGINNVPNSDAENSPSLGLSLKRLRVDKDVGTTAKDNRNILRRSDSSAFSRYNSSSNTCKNTPGNSGNGLLNVNGIKAEERDLKQVIHSCSSIEPLNQCSNWGSNNIDMGSTINGPVATPSSIRGKSVVASSVKCSHLSSSVHPTKTDMYFSSQQIAREKADEKASTTVVDPVRGIQSKVQLQNLHQHCEKQVVQDYDDLALKLLAAPAPHCGSSNVLEGPANVNVGNYSINGSVSGSNHGSSVAANAGGINGESDNGDAGKGGSGSGSGSGDGNGDNRVDQNKLAQREAALRKFRQKRSERCFHKKVRYYSRKKLAEQRPRVRGQFVRKSADENTSEAKDN